MMAPKRPLQGYPSLADRPDELVAANVDLVQRIAHHLAARLPPSVQLDDLVQSGMVGLIEAARQFQAGQGATFATYATIRIRGAMIDELRRADWTPRSVHRNTRRIAAAIREVETREGRTASDAEVAAELEIGLADYHAMLQDSASANVLGIEDLGGPEMEADRWLAGTEDSPPEQLAQAQFRLALAQALGGLPERERLVMNLYYNEALNLREIGAVLGITESRVSQIRSQALHRLRSRLSDWTGEGSESLL
ncbi:RNA polymerase sigma factor FliA [Marichromatium sp. AB31]